MIDLHGMLLQSTKFPIYNGEYYKVLPFIVELRNRMVRMHSDLPMMALETSWMICAAFSF